MNKKHSRYPYNGFSLRRAVAPADFIDCQRLQKLVWGMNQIDIVPVHLLRVFADGGGLVINAYSDRQKPIGTTISFPMRYAGKSVLYSHMTGVLRDYHNKGIGLALKSEQRKFALKEGFDLVCWTYDPLRSQNNWFNLNKLGAVARTYYANYYGNLAARLYRGLDSDRFLAEWWVKSPRVKNRLALKVKTKQTHSMVLNETKAMNGMRRPWGKPNLRATGQSLRVEIPTHIERLQDEDLSALNRWRKDTRQLCLHYFSRGYVVTETETDKLTDRTFIRLERGPLGRILRN
jgi:predicted GNAT superfamily acetyltransferase